MIVALAITGALVAVGSAMARLHASGTPPMAAAGSFLQGARSDHLAAILPLVFAAFSLGAAVRWQRQVVRSSAT